MIKRQKIDLSEERRILSFMITSTSFLTKLHKIAKPRLFKSDFSKTICSWIWEYFDYVQESPGRNIEEIYHKKRKDIKDDDQVELISEFLSRLSKDWEKFLTKNVKYTVKNAIDFFKLRTLDKLKEDLEIAIENNDVNTGESLVSNYKNVGNLSGHGINLLKDADRVREALEKENELLFKFPGDLGDHVGWFARGDFFAIMGAMKKGKTHYLWYTGYRAMLAGLRVLFISLEMSEEQMIRRMWQGMEGKPFKDSVVKMPYFEKSDGKFKIKYRENKLKSIDPQKVEEKQKKYKPYIREGETRLIVYPSGTGSIDDIENEIKNLEYYENFIPDVLIVDYADILKPSSNKMELRHQLDDIWKRLRGMAQKYSIMVVTGTQTNRKGIVRDANKGDVAEDIRKLAHVTKMITINQSESEYERGLLRIGTAVQREGKMQTGEVIVLQSYDIGRPYLDSKIKKKVLNLEDDK